MWVNHNSWVITKEQLYYWIGFKLKSIDSCFMFNLLESCNHKQVYQISTKLIQQQNIFSWFPCNSKWNNTGSHLKKANSSDEKGKISSGKYLTYPCPIFLQGLPINDVLAIQGWSQFFWQQKLIKKRLDGFSKPFQNCFMSF